MRFNTPDNIYIDNDTVHHWSDKDAIPIFMLSNGKIIKCPLGIKHQDYIDSKFTDKNKKRSFINSIILQGRYWKKSNIFAFWNIDNDSENKIKYIVKQLSNSPYTSKVYYNHRIYILKHKEDDYGDYEWFETISEKPNKDTVLNDEKKKWLNHWFESEKNFVDRSYKMSEKKGNKLSTRDLTKYELLAATCYQIWTDFFMNPYSKFDKFNLDDLILYIDLKYHGRVSFKELFDYFHRVMRKKMVSINQENDYQSEDMETENDFDKLMSEFDFGDSEYTIVYYDDNNHEPYSCNIKTDDHNKAKSLIDNIKSNKDFILDRVVSRKINDDLNIYSFRIRKAFKMKENKEIYNNKTVYLNESQLNKLIINERVSSNLYHYTSINNALKILRDNKFWCMSSLDKDAETRVKGHSFNNLYYLSCTRNKHTYSGYARNSTQHGSCVRFELDGDLINSRYKGGAIDYWGNSKINYQKRSDGSFKPYHNDVEAEDRIFTKEPFIENANTIIKRVDVYVDKEKANNLNKLAYECMIYGYQSHVKIYLYDNIRDFNFQTDNTLNGKMNLDLPNQQSESLRTFAEPMRYLKAVLNIVWEKGWKEKDVADLLRSYNLEKFLNKKLFETVSELIRYDSLGYNILANNYEFTNLWDKIELGNNRQNEDTFKISKILNDWCRKHKLSNKRDVYKYFKQQDWLTNPQANHWDLKGEETLYCVNSKWFESKLGIGFDLNTMKCEKIQEGWDENAYDELLYQVRQNENDLPYEEVEKFQKYLKHLLIKGFTVSELKKCYDTTRKKFGDYELQDHYYEPIINQATIKNRELASLVKNNEAYIDTLKHNYIRSVMPNENDRKKIINTLLKQV